MPRAEQVTRRRACPKIIHAQTGSPHARKDLDQASLTHPRDFATNIGIRFHTPEEFFLGEAPQPFVRSFDPATYLETENAAEIDAGKAHCARSVWDIADDSFSAGCVQ